MTITPIYTATATATGGREGTVSTPDGTIDLKLAPPKEMGGSGAGNNPEQLFASGFAACYLGSMKFATSQDKSLTKVPDDASVAADVGIGPREGGGFGLGVKLVVTLPGVAPEEAQKVADAGHRICPYSHAVGGNIEVVIEVR